jgi:hypothetical protein
MAMAANQRSTQPAAAPEENDVISVSKTENNIEI